jgi:hypothetical protein
MNLLARLLVYVCMWAIGTAAYTAWIVLQVLLEAQRDPSAGAILGFLPFLIPVIMVEAGKYILPACLALEVAIFFYRSMK